MKRVYLDHAATTPVRPEVKKIMDAFQSGYFGNPSAIYFEGRQAKAALDSARELVAKILGAETKEIIFTNGGTESINLALFGVSRQYKKLFKKPRLITSQIEHPAVLETMKQLAKEGFEIIYLPVDKFGLVKIKELKKSLNNQTILISIMYANNEIGTIQPIAKIAKIIENFRSRKNIDQKRLALKFPLFHTDACQAAGSLEIQPQKLGVDLMSLNASKTYGPKASGLLYAKKGIELKPIIFGGGQENKLRSGTENVASWIGLAKALELSQKEKIAETKRLKALRDYFIKNLLKIPKTFLNGHPQNRLANNINLTVLNVEGEAMILQLDKYGISASTGSACHSKILQPSHVLMAIGLRPETIHGSLRLTLGHSTTKKEIDYALRIINKVVKKLRQLSAVDIKNNENKK